MSEFLYYTSVALAIGIVVYGIFVRGGYCQLSFCVACLMLGWALPQFRSLLVAEFFPREAIDALAPMIFFVFLALVTGWWLGGNKVTNESTSLDVDRGHTALVVMTVIGAVLQFALRNMAAEQVGLWSGPITILAALSSVTDVAFAFSFLCCLRSRHKLYLYLAIVNFCIMAPGTILSARRGSSMEIIAILVVGMWFQRRWQMPRVAVICGVVLAIIAANNIGNIRAVIFTIDSTGKTISRDYSWSDFLNPDLYSEFKDLSEISAQEVKNAAYIVASVARTGQYNYGASLWNAVVAAYVPGQFIGVEAKHALLVGQQGLDAATDNFNYTAAVGTTPTGFSDSFQMFWYFGALIFVGDRMVYALSL